MDTLVSRSKLKNVSTLGEYATVVKDVSKDKLGEAKDRFALSVRDEVCMFRAMASYSYVLLLSYSVFSGALKSPDILLSYSRIALALHTNNNP